MKETIGDVDTVEAILQAEKDLFHATTEVKRKYICGFEH